MTDVIRIKRRAAGSGNSGAPAALANAELAYNEQDDILYYGKGGTPTAAASIVQVAGAGAFPSKTYVDNADALKANIASPTFTGSPQAPTPGTAVNDTSIATAAFVKAQGYLTGNQTVTLSGDVTGSGATAISTTIANAAVVNAKLANMTAPAFKGRITAGAGAPEDLTGTQATALLDAFTPTLKGLAPSSGGGTVNYLRADGTWAAPSGAGGGIADAPSDSKTYGRKNAAWTDLALAFQPLDADLTAIAALAGTNVIYYRSAADTWSAVTVGTGLSFSGGNLTCTVSTTGFAPLASPVFTGDPQAPTPATADNDTSIATTAFVKAQGYLIGNQNVTLTGDVTGSGATSIAATLATVNPNVGTFQGLTVNAKGLVTAAVNQGYLTGPAAALTAVNDTNVTLALGGTPATALLQATSITVGWVGTLPAARLNANVVQAVANDTNVTGSIAAQTLTLGWAGTLANARLAAMAANTVKGNNTASAATPIDLTAAQLNAMLPIFTSTLNGLAPSSGGGTINFLRADGIWAAPAGGGNVTSVGTPVNGQWAQWTGATSIQGVTTASMPFVQKAGDTMTGDLTISKTAPTLNLTKSASGDSSAVFGFNGTNARWSMTLGNSVTEGGSNAGSDFQINRYTDAGAFIDAPMTITRSSGLSTFGGDVTINKGTPVLNFNKTASGQTQGINGMTNGVMRWGIVPGTLAAESGGNAGSNFTITPFSDAGVALAVPFTIYRSGSKISLGALTGGGQITTQNTQIDEWCNATGYCVGMQSTVAGAFYSTVFINSGGTPCGYISHNDTSTAYNTSSDARLKEDDHPFTRGREVIDKLNVKDFRWKVNGQRSVGMFAQEVEPDWPDAISRGVDGETWGIDYSKFVPLLTQALQEAFKRIDELEDRIAKLEGTKSKKGKRHS